MSTDPWAGVIAVRHQQFNEVGAKWLREHWKPVYVVYDIKYLLNELESHGRL